jgi:hypothetical protein
MELELGEYFQEAAAPDPPFPILLQIVRRI